LEDSTSTVLSYVEQQIDSERIVGFVSQIPSERSLGDERLASLVLDNLRFIHDRKRWVNPTACRDTNCAVQQITDLFDRTLRHVTKRDQWHVFGRDHFLQRVVYFVSRNLPIELCLPAFPCKSSNLDKVSGTLPDRGERIALETLHTFVCAVQKVYDPGALLWIISDGHVFSDCSEYWIRSFTRQSF
jgi:hypothetical protein